MFPLCSPLHSRFCTSCAFTYTFTCVHICSFYSHFVHFCSLSRDFVQIAGLFVRLPIHLCSLDNVLTFAQFIDAMFTSVVNFNHFCSHSLHIVPLSRHFVHLSTRPPVFNFYSSFTLYLPLWSPLVTFLSALDLVHICILPLFVHLYAYFVHLSINILIFTCASLLFTFFTLFATALFG